MDTISEKDKAKSENSLYIIKLKNYVASLNTFRERLNQSKYYKNKLAYYNITERTSEHDQSMFQKMGVDDEYRCAVLDYQGDSICCIYWCICEKCEDEENESMHCTLKYKTENKAIIENFVYNLHLNLDTDFPENSYLNVEESKPLIEQMKKFETKPYVYVPEEDDQKEYDEIEAEQSLSPLAQRNQYCKRKYNINEPQNRSEFQRDYDRIVYSKAFRRMVDKAQIFSSIKGDHYRTRMTHTLIVCQIARSISNQLKLNSPLAEAIAVGHDLGHTPFGHQGERTLHAILTGKPGFEVEHLSLKSDSENSEFDLYPYGGFKHNYQSVRVATRLEVQYPEVDGLDLSAQTLNGMWMHTGKKAGMSIEEFSDDFLTESGKHAFTLEGQVVAVADEIAQRSHDIDDAFTSALIRPKDFLEYLGLQKTDDLRDNIKNVIKHINALEQENRFFSDKDELAHTQISSIIVDYFIEDVCKATAERMEEYEVDQFDGDEHTISDRLVWFSDEGADLCKYLENIISKKVINSREVTLFDQNGSNIVLALFRAYYKNPMLLHEGTLRRIWNEYVEHGFKVVSFKEGKPEIVKDEWNRITTMEIPADEHKRNQEAESILEKRKILVRGICDFISGMTDSYAINEYKKIIP